MLTDCHLSQIIAEQARRLGDRPALSFRNDATDTWEDISWNTFADKVRKVSLALLTLGVEVQEVIGVCSQNKPEILFTDFGAYGIKAISVPMYATSSAAQIQYIVNDAAIRYLFVGEQEQYDTAYGIMSVCPTLERLIIFDSSVKRHIKDKHSLYFDEFLALAHEKDNERVLEWRLGAASWDDYANILYTSGTTGESKGVVFTYRMFEASVSNHKGVIPLTADDLSISFLPLSHIFERGWTYVCIANGVQVAINRRPQDILQALREVHPTCMCAVPRFWEKVYQGVLEKIAESSTAKRKLMETALSVRDRYVVNYKSKGLQAPLALRLQNKLYEGTVIKLLKTTLGLERGRIFPVAGATISPQIERFVHAAGINMIKGYGLTESTATVSCDHADQPFTIGSVGRVMQQVQVKISEEGEVLLKGQTITPGYYKKEEANRKAFTPDGWFRTGDAGYLKDGELFLTDRIKDLFKTSNGKYIAPQMLESKLTVDRYIEQVVVIANERRFVSALIVPNYKLIEDFAREHGILCGTREALCKEPAVIRHIRERIDTLQQEFASYEKIKAFALLPEPLSMQKGELTNTLKIKRAVINQHYATLIDSLYDNAAPPAP